jgi:outer membrane protein OmpA-like peptidoglycan-associated protein
MKLRFLVALTLILSVQCTVAQEVASYYFYSNLQEFAVKYPPLIVTGKRGNYLTEIVPKLGQTPRQVYQFPKSSGIIFDYSNIKNFIQGSYAVEMYFRYDDADLLMYGIIIGERSIARQGEYVHLVTTRDFETKRVNVFLDGKIQSTFIDADDNLAIEPNAQFIFFTEDNEETTSGAVAMIKIYNFFIDEEKAKLLFEPFVIEEAFKEPTIVSKKITLKRLYFVQSEAKLLPESIPEMESLRGYLKANQQVEISLFGHTDNQGDFNLNLKLSRERAENVKAFLVENGIAAKRINTKGYGSLRPVASNLEEETRRLNRRVELEVQK